MVGGDYMGYIIETRNLTKKYGDFTANKEINLQIQQGEVRAIIGENGAGKTTLMSMLYGSLAPTSGEILFDGKPVKFNSPLDAIEQGMGMVHQHFQLAPSLTVYENIILGLEIKREIKLGDKNIQIPVINNKKERKAVADLIKRYNFNLDPNARVKDLSIGAQQRVEILKMLYRDIKVLILDEPTAVLIPQEIEELIAKIAELKRMGVTVIIITHKLNEVKQCADNISVMRRGKLVGTVENNDATTTTSLAEMMVGRPVLLEVEKSQKAVNEEKVVFSVEHLSACNSSGRKVIKDVSFEIHENEVLGVAGIEGNGQTELMYLLCGLMKHESGSIKVNGKEVLGMWPDELREEGIGIVPEDRYRQGVCLPMPVSFNLISGYHGDKRFCNKGIMNYKEIKRNKDALVDAYDIRLSDNDDPSVASLSGGNAQKVIVAREFSHDPKVLLCSQPTRGIDVGATEFIHNQIIRFRDQGKAILMISSELTEVKGLTDRIIVMYEGEIVGEFKSDEVSFNELGLYMSGAKSMKKPGNADSTKGVASFE